ncbi:hydroxyphenylacetyl-CoA thioesterase PaaI [Paracoccus hibiscisoli]|uniref:Hydroxyphenylacetyl-CoA thioesterase PaaI n=1 Tax=Paracoccus hibiscisoli TaxID=2023261 RepID=A0A4V5MTB2_9RHOB|nr:hydroxyphenylacetyl-CoA thioesterase PaaI [Paracoccus hibiscisoli]TJZ80808.1 hydroxyphenylacetyl-CoA thioesterase PaaI [Paracoccus hibiscisoli]
MTDDDLARACAAAMWAQDLASQRLGMVLEDVAPGRAVLSMTITADMVNGHGSAHGGFIFALADSAFAFACNTVDQRSVGQQAAITYLAPARAGERLTATAIERARPGRSGLYDVTVTGADGTVIAEFRGHSRTVKGRILAD